jgi:hypothetical protein
MIFLITGGVGGRERGLWWRDGKTSMISELKVAGGRGCGRGGGERGQQMQLLVLLLV